MTKDELSKRMLDLSLVVPGLLLAGPVIAILFVLIRRTSPGPGLLKQPRVGRNQQPFTCYKLRTMHENTAHVASHMVGKDAVTPLGAVLRKFKLDELPQLWNVLCGDMSLVGPRPCLPSQRELIEARARRGAYGLRPGITGLAQVQGLDMSKPQQLAEVDGQYVRERTLTGDLRLIVQTVAIAAAGVSAAKLRGSKPRPPK